MTSERFAALADSFGGSIERWPAAEQAAARAYLKAHPEALGRLAEAARLDSMLASWTVPGPGAALTARIIDTTRRRHLRRRRLRLWLSGLGTAATLAGGMATGAGVVAFRPPAATAAFGALYQPSMLGAPLEGAEHPAAGDAP